MVPQSRRKTVAAIQIEVLNFVKHYGIAHTAFLTLTLRHGTNLKTAQMAYNNATRRFLKEIFPAWIAVVEFNSFDRPHFHLLVATRHDYRTGFDFQSYNAMTAITDRAYFEHRALTVSEKRERGQLAHNLTTDPRLKALWKRLRERLPDFGFSQRRPAELVPIQKNAEAIAVYVTTQFLFDQLLSFIPKGARLVRFSASCPRVIRACAGISHCLLEATNSGHCALPREMLADQAKALLAIDEPLIREALERLLVNREVLEEQIGEHPLIFLPALRATEAGIAAKIALPVPESQTAIATRGGAEHPVRRMLAEDKLESYKTVIEPEEVQANPVCWKGSRKSSNVF